MQLTDIIQSILQTQLLPMRVERQMYKLLQNNQISDEEMAAIDQLIEAMNQGLIQPIA